MHDMSRIVRDLQEGLSLDKHPVAVLIGAGCPCSVRVMVEDENRPLIADIAGLTASLNTALAENASYRALVEQFREDEKENYTVEDLLSRVRTLLRIVGKGQARGLTAAALKEVEREICAHITSIVGVDLPSNQTPYHWFVDWIAGVERKQPLQVFTTNYDLLLEQAFEERRVPYFDGFIGARQPFFDLRAIEDENAPSRWARLWKLHGSVNWRHAEDGCVTRCFPGDTNQDEVLIHPSELKYDQSRRMPYLAMMDRLRAFMKQPSALLVTSGYSFADDHLNEIIVQGARSNPTAAVFGLLYKNREEEAAAMKLSRVTPTNIVFVASDGGVSRGLSAKWISTEEGVDTICNLGDFAKLAEFLRSLSISQGGGV